MDAIAEAGVGEHALHALQAPRAVEGPPLVSAVQKLAHAIQPLCRRPWIVHLCDLQAAQDLLLELACPGGFWLC